MSRDVETSRGSLDLETSRGNPVRPFKRVLVANRGEIALRVVRACRELNLESVAVYSDADAAALHVRAADLSEPIGPPPPRESYLDGAKVIAAAKRSGADAIHPGYGFLSENADFAQAVEDAELVWIGPPASAIRAMGEKTAARKRMRAAGVPIVPGVVEPIEDPKDLLKAAQEIGFPVMLKAAGGGGGKGIRIVHTEAELLPSFERARSEAQNAFKSSAVYLEKFLARSRHVEIQVLADAHGNVVHLGERECSMQRRHQKVIEESPSPLMTPELRDAMGAAAVKAAAAVGYRGAGTIECLVPDDAADGGAAAGKSSFGGAAPGRSAHGSVRPFYFLEMNTRLQVEHPVTELVTGLDLVHLQLLIASGQPIPFKQGDVVLRGHAIEARLCAEEPERGFAPATGTVKFLDVPGGPGVRLDSALHVGMEVTVHYDSMLGKLIVHAGTRELAIERMLRALEETRIVGVANNAAYLRRLAASDEFRSGRYHTKSIEEGLEKLLAPPTEDEVALASLVGSVLHREVLKRGAVEEELERNGEAMSGWVTAGRHHLRARQTGIRHS